MTLLISIELLVACLVLLWMPVSVAAGLFAREGDHFATKSLKVILPTQLVLTCVLSHAGRSIGLSNIDLTFFLIAAMFSFVGVITSLLIHQLENL